MALSVVPRIREGGSDHLPLFFGLASPKPGLTAKGEFRTIPPLSTLLDMPTIFSERPARNGCARFDFVVLFEDSAIMSARLLCGIVLCLSATGCVFSIGGGSSDSERLTEIEKRLSTLEQSMGIYNPCAGHAELSENPPPARINQASLDDDAAPTLPSKSKRTAVKPAKKNAE